MLHADYPTFDYKFLYAHNIETIDCRTRQTDQTDRISIITEVRLIRLLGDQVSYREASFLVSNSFFRETSLFHETIYSPEKVRLKFRRGQAELKFVQKTVRKEGNKLRRRNSIDDHRMTGKKQGYEPAQQSEVGIQRRSIEKFERFTNARSRGRA